jgi:hypothetical protein
MARRSNKTESGQRGLRHGLSIGRIVDLEEWQRAKEE